MTQVTEAGGADRGVARLLTELRTAVDGLGAVPLDGIDGGTLTDAAATLGEVDGKLAAVTARIVAAVAASGVATAAGAASPGAWLASVNGSSPRKARQAERLATALDAAPSLGAAMAAGRVGTEQAATIAGAVRRGVLPDAVADELVRDAATMSPGAFARETRRREARHDQQRLRRDEAWARRRRALDYRRLEDGSVTGSFRFDAIAGETFVTAIGAFEQPDPAETPDAERRSPTQRRADAAVALARTVLHRGDAGTVRAVRPHVTVTVPVEALTPDLDDAERLGAHGITGGGAVLSAHAVRQVLCDATVRRLVVDPAGRPLNVGRATRTWSGAQRAASTAVDGGCRGPSCDRPADWTELHHLTWWSRGGATSLANGLPLCGHCHDLVHHGRWSVTLDPATRIAIWTAPDGRTHQTRPRGPAAPQRLAIAAAATTAGSAARPTGVKAATTGLATGTTGQTGPPGPGARQRLARDPANAVRASRPPDRPDAPAPPHAPDPPEPPDLPHPAGGRQPALL